MKKPWPLGVLALPFGAVYWLLLCLLPDSIEAADKLHAYLDFYTWRGPDALFALNSIILGWVSVVVLERRFGAMRPVVWLYALPCGLAAIVGGFGVALLVLGHFAGPLWEMLVCSLVLAVGASVVRAYLTDMI